MFAAGIGLILGTFFQAWDIFSKSPQLNLGVQPGKLLDFNVMGLNFARLLIRILLLVVMAGIGSALANRGARLYSAGWLTQRVNEEPKVSPTAVEDAE